MEQTIKAMPKHILVVDTETISVDKRYIYDLGYIVARFNETTKQYEPITRTQEIIEQIYDNKMLFSTAYYESKRERYTSLMKGRKAKKNKFGYAMQNLKRIINQYDIKHVLAYNSSFDQGAFEFTADFFACQNTLKDLIWVDILAISNAYIHQTKEYLTVAQINGWFTTAGNLETNAEKTFAFLTNNLDYVEPHTSLQDADIELDIFNHCVLNGYDFTQDCKKVYVKAETEQVLTIITNGKTYNFKYTKRINMKKTNTIKLS